MIIIKGNVEQLKNSEFYNEECWDYPEEEIDMLKKDYIYSENVYLLSGDRIYETLCNTSNWQKLLEKVEGNIIYSSLKENRYKEKIELLISEGINYLNSQIEKFGLSSSNKNNTLEEYIKKYAPLIANEKIDNMLKENKKEEAGQIIDIFNKINRFIYEKKDTFNRLATDKELQAVFFQYTNMLENNLQNGDLGESFIGWCEDGEVFYEEELKLSNHSIEMCVLTMNHLAEELDEFTSKLFEIYELEIEQENNNFEPFKDPEEDFYVTNNPQDFDYMEYKGFRACYIEDTNTIVIHKIVPGERESYNDYDNTIINRNYTKDDIKNIIDTEYAKEEENEEEDEL